MTNWPDDLEKYSETSVFTDKTVPTKLTREHTTKKGVWGQLVLLEGSLDYVVPGAPEKSRKVLKGETAIIEPQEIHYVTPHDGAAFRVDFYRRRQGASK